MKHRTRTLFTCLCILFGNALMAFSVAAFIMPHGLISGGVTGIGIFLCHFLGGDVSVLVLILNILTLILGLAVLGKGFFLKTVASSLLYPIFLSVFQRIPAISDITSSPLLATLFGGCLVGIAVGIVMRVGASTGGTDVVNLVLHKYTHLPVSILVYACDFLIIGCQALFAAPEQILYAILMLVILTRTLDQVMILGQHQIQIFAITAHYEEIRQKLLHELKAGVTMMLLETGCAREQQTGVLCVIPPRKLYDAKELIHSIDPDAFITVTQIKEVRGQGFSLERRDYPELPNFPNKKGESQNETEPFSE